MDYDDVLEQVGDLGPYQKRLLVIALLPIIYNAFGQSMNNFVLGNHLYRCRIPWFPNDTYAIQDDVHASIVNVSIPLTEDDDYDKCHIIINGTEEKCHNWVFDDSVFTRTANSQVRPVRKLALNTSKSVLMNSQEIIVAMIEKWHVVSCPSLPDMRTVQKYISKLHLAIDALWQRLEILSMKFIIKLDESIFGDLQFTSSDTSLVVKIVNIEIYVL
ncbi:hypothetical protein FSP39_014718 [Pinctada imbricata]|uniref:Uncharacterized protein n=1 Tax=Pinctada imbricata TaxID=66713 RepID=A0AA88Y4K3_PINIB|nr:hypothetical protein FSP39_014718 [Pinctada imbricata]